MSLSFATPRSLYRSVGTNIYDYPEIKKDYLFNDGAQITIGDLHANAVKLIYFLIKHGVATNISKDDYRAFIRIYSKDIAALTREDIKWFDTFIAKTKFNRNGMLRFIGDDLADRGANDYFTLKIFQKLFQSKVPVEVIFSNHTAEFVDAFENNRPYEPANIYPSQAISMSNLNQLIQKGWITRKDIDRLFATEYLPNLKVLSYTFDEKENRIAIFSHAPIGIEVIEALAKKLGVAYKDGTMKELAQTIDNINVSFNENYVKTKKIHTLFNPDAAARGVIDYKKDPLYYLLWNRDYNINRPDSWKGYFLKFIHGHDPMGPSVTKRMYNMDNKLGKALEMNIGEYHVHYTHEKQLMPRPAISVMSDEQFNAAPSKPTVTAPVAPATSAPVVGTARSRLVVPEKFRLKLSDKIALGGFLTAAMLSVSRFVMALPLRQPLIATLLFALMVLKTLREAIYQTKARDIAQHKREPNAYPCAYDKTSFALGQKAAIDLGAYGKSYFNFNAWWNIRSFGAGLYSPTSTAHPSPADPRSFRTIRR